MSNAKKRIEKLFNKKEAHFGEVKTILNSIGYGLIRIKGNHHIFKNKNEDIIILPIHDNLVKKYYIKEILNKINSSNNEKMSL